jgi:hypothetical protein
MKRITLLLMLLAPAIANAQYSTYYTDRLGQPAGQAWTYGNQTFYSSPTGRPVGSAATNGSQPPAPLPMPYPPVIEPLRIEPIRSIEPIQPLRLQ